LLDSSRLDSTVVLDRQGEVLYEARGDDGGRSTALDADHLPSNVVDATVAAEDRRFWSHPGVDAIALVRAAFRDLRRRRIVEGGSTITQQTVKLLLARGEGRGARRGVVAKLRETVVAFRLEHRLTKAQILALYLNHAAYGNQLVGVERASRAYFDRSAGSLTPAQAAFLAALPQRPSTFNPYRDPVRARRRQEYVIVQMGLAASLTPDREREALDERLALAREPAAFVAPHFVERVLAGDRSKTIVTTLDADLQRTVQGIIRAERPVLERIGAHNVAAVVLDNETGGWLAWEGSGNYGDQAHGGAIDGVITPRQPGSALKPFTYALAFEEGETPATVLPDIPSYFPTAEEGVLYAPRNYDNQFRGPLLARRALAGSENVPAVALASRIGVPDLVRFLRSAGLRTFDKTAAYYGLGVTLGDAEVRLDQIVAAYATFARGGRTIEPTFVRSLTPVEGRQLVSPRTAFWITDILSDDEARAYAFGRGGNLDFPFAVAAKTGTSQAYRDNWAIGYTRSVTVGVWVGNFDRRPLIGSSGVSGAGPIFHAIMLAAARRGQVELPLPGEPATVALPEGTVKRSVCALTGLARSPWCPAQIDEWVGQETPSRVCTWHRPAGKAGTAVIVNWPPEYKAWASSQHLADRTIAVVARDRTTSASAHQTIERAQPAPFHVVSPPDGAVYLIDPTLRREFQTLPLRAVAEDRGPIEWRVDGVRVGTSAGALDWPLSPGRHTFIARATGGREAAAAITVK
jgi:penicillin-binding protein 1C